MEIQLADGIADIKLLDTWQANCSTIFIISLILDTCSASACFIVGPTCAKYIWHLPEDRPKILSFERGDLLGLRQLEFQKGQADTKTSRQKSRISWLTTTVPISYTVLYLHIDKGCTSGYAYTNPCIVVHSFYCCIGSKLSRGYDRLPLTLHDLVFQCVKHRHEQVNKLNFDSMQWRRSKVWCVLVSHDQQIRERNPRPSATFLLPYQMSGVLWKSRTLQSKSSMAIFWMGSPKCPLTSLFLGRLKCFQLFSSFHKGFPSRKWFQVQKRATRSVCKESSSSHRAFLFLKTDVAYDSMYGSRSTRRWAAVLLGLAVSRVSCVGRCRCLSWGPLAAEFGDRWPQLQEALVKAKRYAVWANPFTSKADTWKCQGIARCWVTDTPDGEW